jgi:CheY-like chemotaxis protein
MKKILLIEDDVDLFSLLKYNLEKEGFSLSGLQTGKGAIELCRQVRPDLILLDIMLPDSDGLDICKGIRRDPDLAGVPIIFLTARASETDRIVGLELGANDYVVKPFFVRELIARIKLQFRNQTAPPRMLEAGGLELDTSSRQVRLNGGPLALTATEFRSAGVPDEPSRSGLQPRATARFGVGPGPRHHRPRGGCVRASLAPEDRTGPRRTHHDSFRARLRLHLRAAARAGRRVSLAQLGLAGESACPT